MSSGSASSSRVLSGPLAGFTKAQVETLWTAYQAAPFAESLTAASINGQSFTWGAGLGSAEKSRILRAALSQVDPANWLPLTHTVAVRFGSAC